MPSTPTLGSVPVCRPRQMEVGSAKASTQSHGGHVLDTARGAGTLKDTWLVGFFDAQLTVRLG